jgi:hypothetical protein
MAKLTLYPNGVKGGMNGKGNTAPKKRGICNGWSSGSARNNMNFLMSVDTDLLIGPAFTYTRTLRDIPASGADWALLVKRSMKYLMLNGAIRYHFCVEWTRRGVPHMHGIVYLDPEQPNYQLPIDADRYWLKMTHDLGTQRSGQDWKELQGTAGWFKYVSKHAGRGYAHYQRAKGELPPEWQTGTGRMWGKGGQWPTAEQEFELSKEAMHKLRRLIRGYLTAESRTEVAKRKRFVHTKTGPARLKAAVDQMKYRKRMLKRCDRKVSEVRGVSEWAPEAVTMQMLVYLHKNHPHAVERAEIAPANTP